MVMIIFIGMFLEYLLKIFERSENFQRLIRGSIMARRMTNFADPTCQFWLVFAGSPFRIFKKVRIILRPKFTNLNFRLPTI